MHARERRVGFATDAMYYYDGLGDRSKVDVVGYIVDEHAAIPDCQARAVDICSCDFWERLWMADDGAIHVGWKWGCLRKFRRKAEEEERQRRKQRRRKPQKGE